MPRETVDISILIATRNRAALLDTTLSSLANQTTNGLSIEFVVVDNGSTDETQSVLKRYSERVRLVILSEGTAGKSRALNKAMDVARGALFIFTDDDITASPKWIQEYASGAGRYPLIQVFCGPIVPRFESPPPEWLSNHPNASPLFGKFEPELVEGPLPAPLTPFGANFAVRSSNLSQSRFRTDLGPSLENGPLFNEDIEFVRRLQARGAEIVFLPSAAVFHHVPDRCLELSWISERAFHMGRALVAERLKPRFFHKELIREHAGPTSSSALEFERAVMLNFYFGQFFQFQALGHPEFNNEYYGVLEELGARSDQDLLCESARSALKSSPWHWPPSP